MQWIRPTGFFEVRPLESGWTKSVWPVSDTSWRNDPEKKKQFALELSRYPTPFAAACAIFGDDTSSALWASTNWLNDPEVLKAQEIVDTTKKILDKDALCHKLMTIAEEKSSQGYYVIEAKDRISCVKLYAEIQGYIGKNDTTQNFNNFANNNLKVVFVRPDNDHSKIINNKPVEQKQLEVQDQELDNSEFEPLKLKLV